MSDNYGDDQLLTQHVNDLDGNRRTGWRRRQFVTSMHEVLLALRNVSKRHIEHLAVVLRVDQDAIDHRAPVGDLGAENAFRTLIAIEVLQWTPFSILILYSAYKAIPIEIRDAARIDGARGLRLFRLVELPMMAPALVMTLFIRFIDGFRVFDNVYTLVGSGAGGSTTSLSIYIYLAFFKEGAIGKAVAASLILFAASLLLLVIIDRLSARRAA